MVGDFISVHQLIISPRDQLEAEGGSNERLMMKYEKILDFVENILSEPDFSQDLAMIVDFLGFKSCLKNNCSAGTDNASEPLEGEDQLMPLRTREEVGHDGASQSPTEIISKHSETFQQTEESSDTESPGEFSIEEEVDTTEISGAAVSQGQVQGSVDFNTIGAASKEDEDVALGRKCIDKVFMV